ncbi:unnamed protein product [Clonostachys rosea]|uniref:Aminoglycoside phosphotransferase domain-containing protein n=1 Tax=Bionectria ochroleuca TaxID=29856 RepID=A0ABY6UCP9_BIOOC|nr:unnamed protein product [Clonostachys rosea]
MHMLPSHHTCPSPSQIQVDDATWEQNLDDEVEALVALVNVEELCRAASALRRGKGCYFSMGDHNGRKATMNGIYFDAWIHFEDRNTWLVRIPRITACPADLIESCVQNEYATLKWLKSAGVTVPKPYGYGLASDRSNRVGVSYIFEMVPLGKPFNATQATREQKTRVYSQYANIISRIGSQRPCDFACSLAPTREWVTGGAIASDKLTHLGRHGPYGTALDYFESIAERHLDLIADGQLYPEYPKEAFLFYTLLLKEAAPILTAQSESLRGFWLKHTDDNGDHIYVDKEYNILSIVNWQFARFVPAAEAFCPGLFSASIGRLYGGSPGVTLDDHLFARMLRENGRHDLSNFALSGDLARRFQLGLASGLSKREIYWLIKAVLELLPGDHGAAQYQYVEAWCEAQWNEMPRDTRKQKIEMLLYTQRFAEAQLV